MAYSVKDNNGVHLREVAAIPVIIHRVSKHSRLQIL